MNAAAAADDEELDMSNDNSKAAADKDKAATDKQLATACEEAKAEGRSEAIAAERERIGQILGSEEAKTRAGLAQHLALETDMAAEQAIALLAKSAPEAETASALDKAMNKTGSPGVEQPNPPEGESVVTRIDTAKIYESRRQATRS